MASASVEQPPGSTAGVALESPPRKKVPRVVREGQMLQVAGRVFAARGFHGASMDDIAEAAGISKPMLYNYFGSKEGLYFAYVNHSYRELIAAIDAAVAEAGRHPEEQLWAGTLAYYRYVDVHRDTFGVLFREVGDPGGAVVAVRRRIRRRVSVSFDQLLEEAGVEAAAVGGIEPLAEAWVGAARSLANWWLDHPEESAEAVTGRLVKLAFWGLDDLLHGRTKPLWTR